MPMVPVTTNRQEIEEVIADRSHMQHGLDNWLDRNYFTDNSAGQRYVYPGLILAQCTTTNKYVPYNASALYGVGSDTAVGVLERFLDVTLDDQGVRPVVHAKVFEGKCYIWGGARGTVTSGVKTALPMITWV